MKLSIFCFGNGEFGYENGDFSIETGTYGYENRDFSIETGNYGYENRDFSFDESYRCMLYFMFVKDK